ncbi:MAG: gliding motility-associated ABC transporter permease subunit GldF [Saprospiraceae bacterium]|nr:gliding motility-associated ABC transporter permease subunit GldF [Saprospiraceae bacterium]MBK9631373.1 gliding motility-associated ABC transporter permease subunit GldF [Saprospiraceae bacterium]
MWTIFLKEISAFFSSLIGYVVIAVFLMLMGLLMWVFPDTSILYYNEASLDQLFSVAPLILLFMIPAITMRSFSEELQSGTLEILITKPISETQIVLGKYLASLALALITLLPTLFYYYSVHQLGSPQGNLDSGAILGSYIGLIFLAASFSAIGILGSALNKNQIISFLFSVLMCFLFYYGFYFLSKLPLFYGKTDDLVAMIGMDFHYSSISKGKLDSRDLIYFISIIVFFLWLSIYWIKNRLF